MIGWADTRNDEGALHMAFSSWHRRGLDVQAARCTSVATQRTQSKRITVQCCALNGRQQHRVSDVHKPESHLRLQPSAGMRLARALTTFHYRACSFEGCVPVAPSANWSLYQLAQQCSRWRVPISGRIAVRRDEHILKSHVTDSDACGQISVPATQFQDMHLLDASCTLNGRGISHSC